MTAKTGTSMTIHISKEVKQEAQEIFSALGIDMATAFDIFLRQVIRFRGFPFDIRLDAPNEETLAAIDEVHRMKEDPTLGKSYTDIDEMMKELLN